MANRVTINIEKTEYIIIGSRQKLNQIPTDPHIIIGDQAIN